MQSETISAGNESLSWLVRHDLKLLEPLLKQLIIPMMLLGNSRHEIDSISCNTLMQLLSSC